IHIKYREEVGIFCNECESVAFENVHELSNYSHAFIFQCCNGIELKNVSSAPQEGSGRIAASQTDCIHCSMCKGLVSVTGSKFEGAFDDVLNVHGFHFKITDKGADYITVRFMHPQAYGFKPFDVGDKIVTVNGSTLVCGKEYEIKSVEMLDLYRIKLVLAGDLSGINKGEYIEDITKCADVVFKDNYCTRIPTRGVLVTTRGKVLIENNVFDNTQMSGVLISNDAKSWYESGPVKDVTIRGNKFIKCKGQGVFILPENRIFSDYVHSGIKIEDNEFIYDTPRAIYAKNSRDISVRGNTFVPLTRSKPIVFDNCADTVEEDNTVKCAD
ncbi:MAG: right-handed parallel beta-helix repeat-containing protein, partial [Clostridia bacterium]|nr:right-handed parallel beta-helix repeat-containing protein [Clostridia bacterium]